MTTVRMLSYPGNKRGWQARLLPQAKMLVIPIIFFLCWVDYAMEGYTFSLSKCDFSRMFHSERLLSLFKAITKGGTTPSSLKTHTIFRKTLSWSLLSHNSILHSKLTQLQFKLQFILIYTVFTNGGHAGKNWCLVMKARRWRINKNCK